MPPGIDPVPTPVESRTRQVARNIRTAIEAGQLRDGQALPSTRELAKQWNVSVFTINEAMKMLIDEGLVVSESRSKRTVHAPDQRQRNDLRAGAPHVLLIGGYAGSGKSELGRIIARETGWPLIDKDTITRPVVEAALELLGLSPNDRESDPYLNIVRPREYEALMATMVENLECGNSVIATAPFIREFSDRAWIDRTRERLSGSNASMSLVWVHCDAETMHLYLRGRGAARDAGKLGDWSSYLANITIGFRPDAPHHVIENSASSTPLQQQARELIAALTSDTPGKATLAES
ncbi:GntR family transcriptional regulator [Actinoplanes sp. CA-030573]|uniref:GntR family transcriptional regulator n=1 Tax=Actinoplanes sp. CA-030573 TaxID=3239898 RepID=UPI003D8BD9A3